MIFADSITLVPDVEVIAQDIRGERRYDLVRYSFGANVTYIISITGSDGSATECFGGDSDEISALFDMICRGELPAYQLLDIKSDLGA